MVVDRPGTPEACILDAPRGPTVEENIAFGWRDATSEEVHPKLWNLIVG
jgi:hypothetical protein